MLEKGLQPLLTLAEKWYVDRMNNLLHELYPPPYFWLGAEAEVEFVLGEQFIWQDEGATICC